MFYIAKLCFTSYVYVLCTHMAISLLQDVSLFICRRCMYVPENVSNVVLLVIEREREKRVGSFASRRSLCATCRDNSEWIN